MDKFIYTIDNSLSKELCDKIIEMFENDDSKEPGYTGLGVNVKVKNTMDIAISARKTENKWVDIDKILFEKLNVGFKEYVEYLINSKLFAHRVAKYDDTGYLLQRYRKGEGFYDWHNDYTKYKENMTERKFTFIWYLNDVEEGGTTEFISGIHIKPEKGKLVFFPACWTFIHRGNVPLSNDKYICTGWMHSNMIDDVGLYQK